MKRMRTHSRKRGFATVAVIILLMAASAWMMTTVKTHRNLHQELRLLEKQHQQHWNELQNVNTGKGADTEKDSITDTGNEDGSAEKEAVP